MHRIISTSTKKSAVALLPLLLLLAFGIAACGQAASSSTGNGSGSTASNEVTTSATAFIQSSITITKGQSVHFVDEQSGAMHIICIGKQGQCDSGAKGPQELVGNGITIQPGQSHDVPFDTPGTYPITCPIHPDMNMTVTVR